MTVASEISEVEYAGNGVTVDFPIPFGFSSNSDIAVATRDSSGDATAITTGFAITGAGTGSGNCKFTTAPASGITVRIERAPEIVQNTDYTANDAFPAESMESALDERTYVDQYLRTLSKRCLQVPAGDAAIDGSVVLPSVTNRKGKLLYFDDTTGAIDVIALTDVSGVSSPISQGLIGSYLYPRTAAEIAAGVTPTNYHYEPGNVLRYGTNSTPGTTDMSAAFTSALAANQRVRIPAGTYKKTIVHTLTPYQVIEGDGLSNTTIVVGADVVGFVTQYWSKLKGFTLSKSGSHTKNGIEVGSTALDAGRTIISDVRVTGMGNDGIQIIHGNLGQLENIVTDLNGRDGVNFKAGNIDANAWTTTGYIDTRGNTRDGFHVDQGGSLGDSAVSVTNTLLGVTAQENGRYGIYIGTRSNALIGGYGELNTTADIYLDQYARGNTISVLQGTVTDASLDPSFNMVENWNASAGYQRTFQNRILFSGVAAAGWQLFNDDGTAGTLAAFKSAIRQYKFQADGSSANQTVALENAVATFILNFLVDGGITAGATVSDSSLPGKLSAYFNGSTANGQDLQDTNSTNGGTFVRFLIGAKGAGSAIGSITRNAATSAVLYNTTSDGRLKDITGALSNSGDLIDAIKVYDFTWKAGGAADRGVIAQELLQVVPQVVHVPDDEEEPLGVDYSKLVPILIAEVQGLRRRVKQLESGGAQS